MHDPAFDFSNDEFATPIAPYREQAVPIGENRTLGIAEFGAPEGTPIMWFHGTPGARRQIPPRARAIAQESGLRIIGVERPGIGDSTPHLYENLTDWARDIERLADNLGIEDFGLVGLSGGGPYVLSCAYRMPDRVPAAVVLGGVAPTCGDEAAAGGLVGLGSYFEPLITAFQAPTGAFLSYGIRALHPVADKIFSMFLTIAPERDAELLGRPDLRAMFTDDLLTGSKKGLRSLVYDAILFSRPWGFSLREVRVPIHFFQGDADAFVPFSHGAHMAALVPDAELTHRPGEGHLGGLDAVEETIDFILSRWPEPDDQPEEL